MAISLARSCAAATAVGLLFCAAAARATIIGPYAADANTLHLYHFDETAGAADPGNPFVDTGNAGTLYDLTNTGGPDGRDNTGAGGYGATAYSGFGSAFDVLSSGTGTYHSSAISTGGGATGASAILQSQLQGADGAFTWEALVKTSDVATTEQTILSHDGSTVRGPAFRLLTSNVSFYPGTGSGYQVALPSSGDHVFAANAWFHVAVSYSGDASAANNLTFYWTRLDAGATQANVLGTATLTADLADTISNQLVVGSPSRSPYRFEMKGAIDEVRVSDVARTADQFIFTAVPEPSTWALLACGLTALTAGWMRRARQAR